MLKCSTVVEVVGYLKSYTYYREFLDKVNDRDIHRGQVEQVLHEQLFASFLSLCRYHTGDSPVVGFLLRQSEISEVMKYLTLLNAGRPRDYLFSMPLYFIEHTDIDLERMSKAGSYSEFLGSFHKHAYRDILERFNPDQNGKYDLTEIEEALELFSYKELYDAIGKIKDKAARLELCELFDIIIDYNNYSRIVRLKKFYSMSNNRIRTHLLPYGSLKGRKLDELMTHESFPELIDALDTTKVGKKIRTKRIDITNRVSSRLRFELCRHNLYFSQNADVVLLSYYIVSDAELSNVITVIEGVRYGLATNEIKELLIR